MRKKAVKPFTLLEVIIAISLVALAGPILFSVPFRLAKHEMAALYTAELTRLADLEWNSIRLQFLNHEIAWKDLSTAQSMPFLLEERPYTVAFSKQHQHRFVIKKVVTGTQKKTLSANREGGLVKVNISFLSEAKEKEHSFEYQLAIYCDAS